MSDNKNRKSIREAVQYTILFVVLGLSWILLRGYFDSLNILDSDLRGKLWKVDLLYLLIIGCVTYILSIRKISKERRNYEELIETLREANLIKKEKKLLKNSIDNQVVMTSQFVDEVELHIIYWDQDLKIQDVNNYFLSRTGYSKEEIVGRKITDIIKYKNKNEKNEVTNIFKDIQKLKRDRFDYAIICKDFAIMELSTYSIEMKDNNGLTVGMASFGKDTTEENKMEARLKYYAYYDEITGLPNKYAVNNYIKEKKKEDPDCNIAMFYIQIDAFKVRNELYKKVDFDILSQEIGYNISNTIASKYFLAKVSEYEYMIIIDNYRDNKELEDLGERLCNNLAKPIIIGRYDINLKFKIGMVSDDYFEEDIEALIQKAQFVIYNIRDYGKKNYKFFNEEIESKINRENFIMRELELAIENRDFIPYFQPIFDINSGEIIGMETLIRWIHVKEGFISPGEFIPISEKTEQIYEITNIVLEKALEQKVKWNEMGFKDLKLAINISSKSIDKGGLDLEIKSILDRLAISPKEIILEITETASIDDDNLDTSLLVFNRFKDIGVSIALDDFGTGNSTLARLNRIPISYLKLDASFISNLEDDREARYVVENIQRLSIDLNKKMIVEGIEREEQIKILRNMGISLGQGYHLSRPIDERDMAKLLLKNKKELTS